MNKSGRYFMSFNINARKDYEDLEKNILNGEKLPVPQWR
jgi:hypothetical protein